MSLNSNVEKPNLSFVKRVVNSLHFRSRRFLLKTLSQLRIRVATSKFRRRRAALTSLENQSELSPVSTNDIAIFLSYKVTDELRLRILRTVMGDFERTMSGSSVQLNVVDASEPFYLEQTRPLMNSLKLPVQFMSSPQRLIQAYADLLAQTKQDFFYLQFDDFITAGLEPEFLRSCASLLQRYEGLLNVVAVMWPYAINVIDSEQKVEVVAYRTTKNSKTAQTQYHFGFGEPQTPIFVEKVGDYEFGIFENFVYGIFFNHLIAPTRDYETRLRWYMSHISQISAHTIELAAEDRTQGPFWTHIAICLSDISLVDLDYAHTQDAVRPEIAANEKVCDALNQGYQLKVTAVNNV